MKENEEIKSVDDFVCKLLSDNESDGFTLFFRGHPDKKHELKPGIFRHLNKAEASPLSNEDQIFREILTMNPSEFGKDKLTIEKLSRMQHYGLPTRLLDLSMNPLVGLYFACEKKMDRNGEVIVFKIENSKIKFSDSDTVSCLSNLALLGRDHYEKLSKPKGYVSKECSKSLLKEFNEKDEVEYWLHHIKEEKPYFKDKIDPDDLDKVLCVRSAMSSDRIRNQSGAFFLFGKEAVINDDSIPGMIIDKYTLSHEVKKKCLSQLKAMNVSIATIYPRLENTSVYIKEKYKIE